MKLRAIDLFSGIGGLTLGLKQAGFEVVAAIEISPVAAETYMQNHGDICRIVDIRRVDVSALRRELGLKRGELSLLAACPPCQGFSSLRTRKQSHSVNDERNDLLFELLRFADEFEPKAILMENVPSLIHDNRMKLLVTKLRDKGYDVDESSARIEDAADHGVPQRRKRLIFQAIKSGRTLPLPAAERVTVRAAFLAADLGVAGASGDPVHDLLQKHTHVVRRRIAAIPLNGGSRHSLPEDLILRCHKQRPDAFGDVYGRIGWDDVAPTMTGGCTNPSKGRFLHPTENRAITLREAAVLQSFPKDYKISLKHGRDSAALMIGNALPPAMIQRHASQIAKVLRNKT